MTTAVDDHQPEPGVTDGGKTQTEHDQNQHRPGCTQPSPSSGWDRLQQPHDPQKGLKELKGWKG